MKKHRQESVLSQAGAKRNINRPKNEPLRIRVEGTQPKWEIPEDVVDEMLAVLREQENVAHE